VPPGTAFTIDTQVLNSAGSNITATAGNGGTVFALTNTGTYALDYEMSLGSAGAVALYTGLVSGGLGGMAIDNNTTTGSSTATSWIHGRAFITITQPTYIEVSSAIGTAVVVTAGNSTEYMIRLTIIQVL